jgi:hypothetical protein
MTDWWKARSGISVRIETQSASPGDYLIVVGNDGTAKVPAFRFYKSMVSKSAKRGLSPFKSNERLELNIHSARSLNSLGVHPSTIVGEESRNQ